MPTTPPQATPSLPPHSHHTLLLRMRPSQPHLKELPSSTRKKSQQCLCVYSWTYVQARCMAFACSRGLTGANLAQWLAQCGCVNMMASHARKKRTWANGGAHDLPSTSLLSVKFHSSIACSHAALSAMCNALRPCAVPKQCSLQHECTIYNCWTAALVECCSSQLSWCSCVHRKCCTDVGAASAVQHGTHLAQKIPLMYKQGMRRTCARTGTMGPGRLATALYKLTCKRGTW